MIFLFGFGYAKPVEVRMRHFKKPKRDMALVALAGPFSNFIQAFIYILISAIFSIVMFETGIHALGYICTFFTFAALINIRLGVFNMIPIPPLDGSRLLYAFLPSKALLWFQRYEQYFMWGLLGVFLVFNLLNINIIGKVTLFFVNLLFKLFFI